MSGDVAEQVGNHALRQVVGFDLAGDGQLAQFGDQPPVAADHPPDQPFVAEMVQAALAAVALTGGVDQGQIAGSAGFQEIAFQRDGQVLGEADADETAGGHGVAVPDQPYRFIGGNGLALAGERLGGQQGVRVGSGHGYDPVCRKFQWVSRSSRTASSRSSGATCTG